VRSPTSYSAAWHRDEAGGDTVFDRRAFDQFHYDGPFFDAVNRRDVGMIQRCQQLCLADNLANLSGSLAKTSGKTLILNRHIAIQFGVRRTIHLAHTSRSDRIEVFVGPSLSPEERGTLGYQFSLLDKSWVTAHSSTTFSSSAFGGELRLRKK